MDLPKLGITDGRFKNADKCTHCGYCLPHCPTYRVENSEIQSPRGRVSMVLALASGDLSIDDAMEPLSHCLICRACHTACPVGVRPGKLMIAARSHGKTPKATLPNLFHRITDSHRMTRLARESLTFYKGSPPQTFFRNSLPRNSLPALHRIEQLVPEPHSKIPPPTPLPQKKGEELEQVAVFSGCMARLFMPNVPSATQHIIQALGIATTTPQWFGCCGAPYREQGERKQVLRQAKRVIKAFKKHEPFSAIVCDSSTCASAMRGYGKLLSKDPLYAEAAKAFSSRVIELSQFLYQKEAHKKLSWTDPGLGVITYHDHCQVRHGYKIVDQPRQLLKALPITFNELPRADRCCGAGGDYQLRHPVRSAAIRSDKLLAIKASGADTVVGSNPGCLLNIEAGCRDSNLPVKAFHLAEVLYAAWVPSQ